MSAPAPDNSAMKEFVQAVNRLSAEHRQILLLVSVEELSIAKSPKSWRFPWGL